MGRIERINEVIKSHDSKLFCESHDGKLGIFRKNWKWEPYEVDGDVYYFMRPDHFFIFGLTHDWTLHGESVDWGLIPIANRLKEIDLWSRDIADEAVKQEEKYEESSRRDRRSKNEDFLREFRPQFAKATNDINVSSLEKKDFRKNYEKRIKEI